MDSATMSAILRRLAFVRAPGRAAPRRGSRQRPPPAARRRRGRRARAPRARGPCTTVAHHRGCRRARRRRRRARARRRAPAWPARRSASGSRRRAPRRRARSASSAAAAARVVDGVDRCAARASSPARISIATMPWPGAGTHALERQRERDARREAEPAQAGRGQHQRIVLAGVELAQPRVEVAANRREARAAGTAASAARRAARCSVPIDGDWPSAATSSLERRRCVRPRLDAGSTTASRGSSRGSTPAIARPSGSTAGMSLLLCTARSISSLSSASSISFTNSRLPPTSDSGASCRRSPDVLMTTISARRPAGLGDAARRRCWPARARAGCRACRGGAADGHAGADAQRLLGLTNGSTRRSPRHGSTSAVVVGARRRLPSRPNSRVSASA